MPILRAFTSIFPRRQVRRQVRPHVCAPLYGRARSQFRHVLTASALLRHDFVNGAVQFAIKFWPWRCVQLAISSMTPLLIYGRCCPTPIRVPRKIIPGSSLVRRYSVSLRCQGHTYRRSDDSIVWVVSLARIWESFGNCLRIGLVMSSYCYRTIKANWSYDYPYIFYIPLPSVFI